MTDRKPFELPLSLVEAIARMEGWLNDESRCRRNHNPGNMEYGDFAKACGAWATDGRFAIFHNDQEGFNALSKLLLERYLFLTIEKAINKYAPPTENDSTNYVKLVCLWTGYKPDTVITPDMCASIAVY